jgi:hypothetical protein
VLSLRVWVGRCLGLPAALLIFVTQAFFLAAMDPITPLLAASLAGLANLLGDILLVCGLGWGIAGASLATAVAQACHPLHSSRSYVVSHVPQRSHSTYAFARTIPPSYLETWCLHSAVHLVLESASMEQFPQPVIPFL